MDMLEPDSETQQFVKQINELHDGFLLNDAFLEALDSVASDSEDELSPSYFCSTPVQIADEDAEDDGYMGLRRTLGIELTEPVPCHECKKVMQSIVCVAVYAVLNHCLSQAWSALSESFQVTTPPHARLSPVWGNGEVQDLSSVCGEEAVQSQLRSSRMNYDTFGQISRDMMERGHDWDALQCRVKVKVLRNAYCKAREANHHSGAAPTTCRFYKELDTILGGDPISIPSTTMATSEPSSTRQEEEEESRSQGAEEEEDTPASLDACSKELFSSQEEGSQSWRPVLGEGQTPEEVSSKQLLFWAAA
ncbi:Zinc finger and SCAN domain-containing protein 29 [Chelonia mydas]|uniref:Zinc finger and SCAN domain-containing protein 29 n=1 Tax=Chelonia mydas TaxID=8469 RepID=M7B6T5_CHEMY|nr:Zinc finger and SCAN domain-containing protein 29 [Chelonia mydas]